MPAPNDLNSQIALAKGWTWSDKEYWCSFFLSTHWLDPTREAKPLPDWTGTLEGCAELMQELDEHAQDPEDYGWVVKWHLRKAVCLHLHQRKAPSYGLVIWGTFFVSKEGRPGDCIGEAWLSIFEKPVKS